MGIFENLENLNVSEECFNDIMDIVENIVDYARKKEGKDTYSEAGPTLSSLLKARDAHKNLLAQAKSIRKHYKNSTYNNDIDYDKLDRNVNREKEAVDSLNKLTSDGGMQETDVKDILTREAEHKKELKKNKEDGQKRGSSLTLRAKNLYKSVKRPHEKNN